MSLNAILQKLKKYWYIIIIFGIIGGYFSIQQASQTEYSANIVIAINPSSDPTQENDTTQSMVYNKSTIFMSQLMTSQLIQGDILDEMNEAQSVIPSMGAFYTITPLELGYISLDYKTDQKSQAESFIKAVNTVYSARVIPIWNQQKPTSLIAQPANELPSKIVELKKPSQQTILPLLLSLMVGICIVLFVPASQPEK